MTYQQEYQASIEQPEAFWQKQSQRIQYSHRELYLNIKYIWTLLQHPFAINASERSISGISALTYNKIEDWEKLSQQTYAKDITITNHNPKNKTFTIQFTLSKKESS